MSFYPLARGSREDTRFQRRLLRILAFTAIAVAAVGLLQRFAWNGRILWVFVPWDWGVPRPTSPQTSGPFVSRNNFGGYLALTLPLVLVPFLTPSRMDLRGRRTWTRVLFGAGAALTAAALLFSLSRGAWVASAVSIGVLLLGLSRRLAPEQLPRFLRSKRAGAAAACACAAAILFLILVPTGGSELGSDIDRRLEQSVTNSVSWDSRAAFWLDSLPMIGDFAAFGVGLGSWGAIFPRYDGSFFFGTQARRAHNDYVQLLSETGILGALLLLGACVAIGVRLHRATRERSEDALAPGLAIGAGLVALAIHEFVDFDLQMPGIAVTATVLFGPRPAGELARAWPVRGLGPGCRLFSRSRRSSISAPS